ncbi:unnamed protein product, partial [Dicrocoelium dendriticum]
WKEANWSESIIYKKGSSTDCSNHRGISPTPVVTKLLSSILVRHFTVERRSRIGEEQAGFRPGRGCIDHIFTLRQVLEQADNSCVPRFQGCVRFNRSIDSVRHTCAERYSHEICQHPTCAILE